jgi:hypothetical protein
LKGLIKHLGTKIIFVKDYDLVGVNCESFAAWCKTGKLHSQQISQVNQGIKQTTKASFAAPGAVGGYALAVTKAVQVAATEKTALNPVAKALINVGLKEAPKAAFGVAGAGGVVSGLATDYIIDQCLGDDNQLSNSERNARKTARTVGKVASTVGALGGSAAGAMVVGGAGAMIAGAIAAPVVLDLGTAFAAYHLFKD